MTADYPTLIHEVAFTTTPADPSPAWEDVTDDLRSARTRRGRQQELDRYQAGTLDVVLGNTDRQYDPENAAGDHAPDVKPMRRTRLRATWNGVTYPIIDAYTDKWEQDYNPPTEARATLRATDGFKILTKKALVNSAYIDEVLADSPAALWRLGEPEGSTTAFDSAGQYDATYQAGPQLGQAGLISRDSGSSVFFDSASNNRAETAGNVITGFPFSIEVVFQMPVDSDSLERHFYDDMYDSIGNSLISLYVGPGPPGPGGNLAFLVQKNSVTSALVYDTHHVNLDGLVHHVVVTATANNAVKLYVDGVDVTNVNVSSSDTFPAGTFKTMIGALPISASPVRGADSFLQAVAVYHSALSSTRVAAHHAAVATPWDGDTPAARLGRILDLADWPAGLRDLDTGQSTLQSADLQGSTALDHAQKVAESDFGELYMSRDGKVRFVERTGLINRAVAATFGDGPGELGYQSITFDNGDELIRNPVVVSRNEGIAQSASDPTDLGEYLDHTYTVDGLIHDSDDLSRYAAQFLVSEYKDPKTRVVGLVVAPAADPTNLWPVILGLELGDVVTVVRRPQGVGDPISQDCEVQGIAHDIGPRHWRTTLTLSPAYTGAFLQLDLTSGPGLGDLRLYF